MLNAKGVLVVLAFALCLLACAVPAQTFAEEESLGHFDPQHESVPFAFDFIFYIPDWIPAEGASADDVTLQVSRDGSSWVNVPEAWEYNDAFLEYAREIYLFNVGTYTIYMRALDADGSVVAEAEDTLAITPFELVLTPKSCTKTYGDGDPLLDVTTNAGIHEQAVKDGISYSVTREQGETVGEYKMQVSVTKEYQDSFHITCDNESANAALTIVEKDCNGLAVQDIDDVVYTGEAIEPEVLVQDLTLKVMGLEQVLTEGRDYTLHYSDNTNVGKAYVMISFAGNYCGTKTVSFMIVRTPAAQVVVDLLDSLTVTSLDDTGNVRQAYASYQLLGDVEKQSIPTSSLERLARAFDQIELLEAEEEAAEYAQMVKDFETGKDTIEHKGAEYRCIGANKLALVKAPNVKKFTVPATVAVYGTTYKVVRINTNAFKGAKKLKKVTLGKNVSKIQPSAFAKSKVPKLKTVVVKTKKLTKKSSVKGCFKKSAVKSVAVKVSTKKSVNKSYVKKYTKTLGAKKVSGKAVTIK